MYSWETDVRKFTFNLSLILIFTIPWEDAITIAGINSITRYIGILISIVWIISIILSNKVRRPSLLHVLFFFFILWNGISLLWTLDYGASLQEVVTYVQLFVLTLIIWDLYTSTKELNKGIQTFILGCYILIITTVINYTLGREIKIYSGGRYAGVGNAGDMALVLSIGLPMAWHLAITEKNKNKNLELLNYMYIPCALFAILLTGTRMALIAVIPAIIFIVGTFHRVKPAVRFTSFFVIIGAMFWLEPLIPRTTLERLATTFSSLEAGDLGGRVEIWRQSIAYWFQNPIIGIGSGALDSPFVLNTVAHNTFLSVLTEVGIIGLFIFFCILLVTLLSALRQRKDFAKLWITVLAVWAIGVFTLTWEYKKVTWLLLTLIMVIDRADYAIYGQESTNQWQASKDIPQQQKSMYLSATSNTKK
jgi:O-antigen ligase